MASMSKNSISPIRISAFPYLRKTLRTVHCPLSLKYSIPAQKGQAGQKRTAAQHRAAALPISSCLDRPGGLLPAAGHEGAGGHFAPDNAARADDAVVPDVRALEQHHVRGDPAAAPHGDAARRAFPADPLPPG